jgi:hypothetical protein
MSDEPNKMDRKLNREGEKQTLRGVVGEDVDDLDIFGYELVYTTGEFTIDRDDLMEKCDELGIPEWMRPGETAAHHAFGYSIDDLLDGRQEINLQGDRVRLVLDQNESRYSYSLDARVFIPPEMTSTPDGMWTEEPLGVIKYDNPDGGEPRVEFVDRVDPDKTIATIWGIDETETGVATDGLEDYSSRDAALEKGSMRARMEALFELHRESNRGKDINNMTYYLANQWTDAIRLRDAAYFVPANHTWTDLDNQERPIIDLIDAYRELYGWLNREARKPKYAQATEMSVIEIMDTERQREMVEQKVQRKLSALAEDMAAEVIDDLSDDDTLIEDVTEEVSEALENLRAMAGEYDDLLSGGKKVELKQKKAVERAMKRAMGGLDTDEQELVETVMEEADAADLDIDD